MYNIFAKFAVREIGLGLLSLLLRLKVLLEYREARIYCLGGYSRESWRAR